MTDKKTGLDSCQAAKAQDETELNPKANSTPKPPEKQPVNPEAIPEELKNLAQWVCWRLQTASKGKPTKVPYQPNGRNASTTDKSTWAPFETCFNAYKDGKGFDGIGFVLSNEDPFCIIDLDYHAQEDEKPVFQNELLEPWARKIIMKFESYTEISPSGNGVHIVIKGRKPIKEGEGPRSKSGKDQIEIYDSVRYLAFTGDVYLPAPIHDRQQQLEELYYEVFPPQAPLQADPPKETALRLVKTTDISDEDIIAKAEAAANGDKFKRLWSGNWEGYPSQSEADLALCGMLSFWTGDDPQRISDLYRMSNLADTMKNNRLRRDDAAYVNGLAKKALTSRPKFYDWPSPKPAPVVKPDPLASIIPGSYMMTDMGNAERLVAMFGKEIHYCYDWHSWLVWTGKFWKKDNSGQIDKYAKKTAKAMLKEASTLHDIDKSKDLAKHAIKTQSDGKRKDMISSAQSEPGIPIEPKDFDKNPWLLNVLNGTIDLKTGVLREHNREDLIMKMAPVEYDPAATCPKWEAFLDLIMDGKKSLIDFLQRITGYSLTGSTQEQCIFFLYGLGANGKSTYLNAVRAVMGDYAKQAKSETFMLKRNESISNDIADLKGARFIAASETEYGRVLAEVLVKEITGGDTQKARFLYSDFFEFTPEFKIFLAANHKPTIKGTDYAIWRRIKLIPFSVQIPEDKQDKTFSEKLLKEAAGILNWAIKGCLTWQENGLGTPDEVKAATDLYKDEMDILKEFMNEFCEVGPNNRVSSETIYTAYLAWCNQAGEKKPLSRKEFGNRMTERQFDRLQVKGKVWYTGLDIKSFVEMLLRDKKEAEIQMKKN